MLQHIKLSIIINYENCSVAKARLRPVIIKNVNELLIPVSDSESICTISSLIKYDPIKDTFFIVHQSVQEIIMDRMQHRLLLMRESNIKLPNALSHDFYAFVVDDFNHSDIAINGFIRECWKDN